MINTRQAANAVARPQDVALERFASSMPTPKAEPILREKTTRGLAIYRT